MKKRLVLISMMAIVVAVGLLVYFGQRQNRQRESYYSGTIEATQSQLSFQTGGRVAVVHVREGDSIKAGQRLAELDTDEWTARYEQARAALDRAGKNTREMEILLNFYQKSLPAEVTRARANVKVERTSSPRQEKQHPVHPLFERGVGDGKRADAVKLHYDNAIASLTEGEAAFRQAESGLNKIEATRMELEAARAQTEAARSALKEVSIQLAYTTLSAPSDGIITSRNVEPGEVVTPGREVFHPVESGNSGSEDLCRGNRNRKSPAWSTGRCQSGYLSRQNLQGQSILHLP